MKLPLPVSFREQEDGNIRLIASEMTGHMRTVGECDIEKSGKIEDAVNVNVGVNHQQGGAAGWM